VVKLENEVVVFGIMFRIFQGQLYELDYAKSMV
jgi:hypothetical protein